MLELLATTSVPAMTMPASVIRTTVAKSIMGITDFPSESRRTARNLALNPSSKR